MFSPVLLEISRIIAFCPLFLAKPNLSLKESLISATSFRVTTASVVDFIGIFKRSSLFSIKLGIFKLKLPFSLLNVPAGIIRLLFAIDASTSLFVSP